VLTLLALCDALPLRQGRPGKSERPLLNVADILLFYSDEEGPPMTFCDREVMAAEAFVLTAKTRNKNVATRKKFTRARKQQQTNKLSPPLWAVTRKDRENKQTRKYLVEMEL